MGKATDYLFLLVIIMALYAGYLFGKQIGRQEATAALGFPLAALGPASQRMRYEDDSLKAELRYKKPLRAEKYQHLSDLNVLFFNSLAPALDPDNDQAWLYLHNLNYGLRTAAAYNQSLLRQSPSE